MALVATLCICIVFVPMFFLNGVVRYLFVPLAEAIIFAMLASYVLSRSLIPTLAKYWLRMHEGHGAGAPPDPRGCRVAHRGRPALSSSPIKPNPRSFYDLIYRIFRQSDHQPPAKFQRAEDPVEIPQGHPESQDRDGSLLRSSGNRRDSARCRQGIARSDLSGRIGPFTYPTPLRPRAAPPVPPGSSS
jgi:AcrB/AcrD/AcrF family